MIQKLLAKVLQVSPETIEFATDQRKRYVRKLWIILPLSAWTSLFYQLNPLFTKWYIDSLTQNWTNIGFLKFSEVWQVFLVIIIAYLFLNLVDKVLNFFKSDTLQRLDQQTESYLEDKFTNFLTKFDSSFLNSENNVRLIRNLQWSIGEYERRLTSLMQGVIDLLLGTAALLVILPQIHFYLLTIIVSSVILDLYLDYTQNQAWRRFELIESRKANEKNELKWKLIWYFNQILSNSWLEQILVTYRKRREDYQKIQYDQQTIDRRYILAKEILNVATYAGGVILGGYLLLSGQIAIGTFVIFGLYIDRLKGQITSIGNLFRTLVQLRFDLFTADFLFHIKPKLDYSDIQNFSDIDIETIEIKDLDFKYPAFFEDEHKYLLEMQRKLGLVEKEQEILTNTDKNAFNRLVFLLKNLKAKLAGQSLSTSSKKRLKKQFEELEKTFTKAEENKIILENLNVKFEKGKIYALVGYNGAGKTTLTKLIKRVLDPANGQIIINNKQNLKNIDPIFWKKYIASLEQNSFLWESLNVRENLLLGMDHEIDDTILFEAIKKVGLDDKITDLDLILGENIELSGGQQQLLEIARLYVQKKPVVIMDEGTNQLDAIKENKIMELLQDIKKHSIIIFITHRMTTCSRCDEVLVLENGKLEAKGNPSKLLNSKESNLYQRFWQMQVEGKSIN